MLCVGLLASFNQEAVTFHGFRRVHETCFRPEKATSMPAFETSQWAVEMQGSTSSPRCCPFSPRSYALPATGDLCCPSSQSYVAESSCALDALRSGVQYTLYPKYPGCNRRPSCVPGALNEYLHPMMRRKRLK